MAKDAMMKARFTLLASFLALAVFTAQGAESKADPPLVGNGDLSLTTQDFEAYMLRIPEHHRRNFRTDLSRIQKTVDGLWVQRMLAKKAREAGIGQDDLSKHHLAQAQEAVLADTYPENLQKNFKAPANLEARAKEIYTARMAEYTRPATAHVQQIIIGLHGRTKELALERARKGYDERVSTKGDFLEFAARYSEDPALRMDGGDPGPVAMDKFPGPLAQAIEKMKERGEISEPVFTANGYHIIKFL